MRGWKRRRIELDGRGNAKSTKKIQYQKRQNKPKMQTKMKPKISARYAVKIEFHFALFAKFLRFLRYLSRNSPGNFDAIKALRVVAQP
jgi:hypothetical protein